MNDDELTVRPAVAADWPGIWAIVKAVVARGDTYAYDPDIAESEAREEWMLNGSDRHVTYVAELDDQVVATAILRPSQPGLGDHIANAGWMVAPESSGRGIGRQFAGHVIEEARRLGFKGMQFNFVVATNIAAIGLWESLGFAIVGTVPDAFRQRDRGLVPIHVMYRPL